MIQKLKQKLLHFLTDKEIETEFLKRYNEDILTEEIEEKEEKRILDDLKKIEGIEDFLKSILKKDRIRFFNSPKETQDVIRGSFVRTLWLLTQTRSNNKEEKTEYKNNRYG